jgi:DNA-binding MarR family transcriptional regulator
MDPNIFTREVEEFSRVDPEMQLSTMLTFLEIAKRGHCTQKDIELVLGLTNASASRNVGYWCEWQRHQVPGRGFVTREENPEDRRYKLLRLTPKGKAFYERLRRKDYGKTSGQEVAS